MENEDTKVVFRPKVWRLALEMLLTLPSLYLYRWICHFGFEYFRRPEWERSAEYIYLIVLLIGAVRLFEYLAPQTTKWLAEIRTRWLNEAHEAAEWERNRRNSGLMNRESTDRAKEGSENSRRFDLGRWALMACFYSAVTYTAVLNFAGHPRSWIGWFVGGIVVLAWFYFVKLVFVVSRRIAPHLPAAFRKQPTTLLVQVVAGIIIIYSLMPPLHYFGALYPRLYDPPTAIGSTMFSLFSN